jgi:DNA-directed RNA polymerase I subunit RPA2
MTTCLDRAIAQLLPFDYIPKMEENQPHPGFQKLTLWYESVRLGTPVHQDLEQDSTIYPAECRTRGLTYAAPLFAVLGRKFDEEMQDHIQVKLGDIPVMIGSKFCNLRGLSEKELVKKGEDMSEFGGQFLVNGNEKVIRMLIVPKRNYPVVFSRSTFVGRGKDFTSYACQMR